MKCIVFPLFIPLFVFVALAGANELNRAAMLSQHGLVQEAKLAYINLLFDTDDETAKSACLYNLGLISFNEDNLHIALETWKLLLKEFPDSKEGKTVAERIDFLSSRLEELSNDYIDNEIAKSYLDHAKFYSDRFKARTWIIDTSYLNKFDMALHWYDKVISEFPGTAAANIAYIDKFKTILGDDGRDGDGFNKYVFSKKSYARSQYLPLMLICFEDYARAFPESSLLNRMRYQIAQAYWYLDDMDQAVVWLEKVIANGQGDDDFYVYTAKQRMMQLKKGF